ncbi:MAG TPA: hypothetical protein PKO06_14535, partial [Candidatus Ozemobacteraceae bacterium]|nr:hypothetical protein [Candidatus Ozemobacteraceae bacterium]
LLKNITRRMESLENHIKTLEGSLSDARQHMELTMNQRLLLAAPPRPVATWQPEAPPVDDTYLSRFSWWERIFKPERMRRPCLR